MTLVNSGVPAVGTRVDVPSDSSALTGRNLIIALVGGQQLFGQVAAQFALPHHSSPVSTQHACSGFSSHISWIASKHGCCTDSNLGTHWVPHSTCVIAPVLLHTGGWHCGRCSCGYPHCPPHCSHPWPTEAGPFHAQHHLTHQPEGHDLNHLQWLSVRQSTA
jgi:hypothetical protein